MILKRLQEVEMIHSRIPQLYNHTFLIEIPLKLLLPNMASNDSERNELKISQI